VLADLELISNVSAASLERSSGDSQEDVGGKRPPGGTDRQGDREPDYPQKSAGYIRRRIKHAAQRGVDAELDAIIREGHEARDTCRRQPEPAGIEPERGTLQWKRMIANSPERNDVLASRHQIKKRTVYLLRQKYGDEADRIDRRGWCAVCGTRTAQQRRECAACEEFREARESGEEPFAA
jgi:hypothetical protein